MTAVTGLILAGGQGRRMGSVNKGLQPFLNRPMVEHVIQRLQPQVHNLIISANQNLDAYRSYGLPTYTDEMSGFLGPLAGFHAGLTHCTTSYMMTVPCDAPLLPRDLVSRLTEALQDSDAELAVAVTGSPDKFKKQSVCCLMRTALLPHLSRFLQNDERKVDAWQASLNVVTVYFSDDSAFVNLNTLKDLQCCELTQTGLTQNRPICGGTPCRDDFA